jgi:hypothetical protein
MGSCGATLSVDSVQLSSNSASLQMISCRFIGVKGGVLSLRSSCGVDSHGVAKRREHAGDRPRLHGGDLLLWPGNSAALSDQRAPAIKSVDVQLPIDAF